MHRERLGREVEICRVRLDRAKKLLGGLGGEKQRWADSVQQVCVRLQWCSSSTVRVGGRRGFLTRFGCVPCRVDQLDRDGINLIGDVLVASASIAYAGPFTPDFREALVTKWQRCLDDVFVVHTTNCTLRTLLADATTVR